VLASDGAQRIEVHRARISQRLINTISEELSPRVLRKLLHVIHGETFSALTRTRPIHVVSECVRLQDLQSHLLHDLVVSLFQDPVSKTVLPRRFPRYEIHVCNRDMRVGVAPVAVEMHNDIARRVRCNLLRECIGSISNDHRGHRITRIKLVL